MELQQKEEDKDEKHTYMLIRKNKCCLLTLILKQPASQVKVKHSTGKEC